MDLNDLRQQRAALVAKMRALTDKAGTEKRGLSAEETAEWERLDADQEALKAQLVREERQRDLERETAEQRGRSVSDPNREGREIPKEERDRQYAEAFNLWAGFGHEALSPEQRNVLATGRQSLSPSEQKELRAQGVATGGAGGYTVPQGFSGEYDKALKAFSGVLQACRILPTASGATLPWPTVNDTAQVGEQLGENTAAALQDVTFGVVNLDAYKYSSKIMLVSIELAQDSAFGLDALLGELAGERIGRILNQRLTTGTGTSQPNGIVTAAAAGVTLPVGNTTSLTYDGIIDLEHAVDPAYRNLGGCAFMLHDTTLKTLKKVKDSQNRPLWKTSLADGEPDSIDGYPFYINQDMAVPAANAKTILFGQMKKYIVRQVRDTFLFRFNEKYMDAGQVGFVAFARYDGDLIDAGTNPVKYLAQSAT